MSLPTRTLDNSARPQILSIMRELDDIKARLINLVASTEPQGNALKIHAKDSLMDQRAYAIYLDNSSHLLKALDLVASSVDNLSLIRNDACTSY